LVFTTRIPKEPEYPNGAPGIRPPLQGASTYVLNLYHDAMTQGSVSSSGQTGSTASGTTTYGVTTNYRTVKWNNEFYDLSASARGVHTLHEALHQVAGFSDAALAEAAKKITNGGTIGDSPSQYLNSILGEYCR
jgi:hypothetical protein